MAASLPTCRTLMAITADEATNLETALIARAIRKDVPVVLRLFDADFADRIQQAFNITVSRSVSYLAAPAFAAHMLQALDTVSIGRHVLLVAELDVGAYSTSENRLVGDLRRPREAWILELTDPHGQGCIIRCRTAPAAARRQTPHGGDPQRAGPVDR